MPLKHHTFKINININILYYPIGQRNNYRAWEETDLLLLAELKTLSELHLDVSVRNSYFGVNPTKRYAQGPCLSLCCQLPRLRVLSVPLTEEECGKLSALAPPRVSVSCFFDARG